MAVIPSHSDDQLLLQNHLDAVWPSHALLHSHITVEYSSAGSFHASRDCETPALWIFLVGQFRTFTATAATVAAFANRSAPECFMIADMIPSNETGEIEPQAQERKKKLHNLPSPDSLPLLVEDAQRRIFGGRLAYALVRRGQVSESPTARFPGCLALYWHGCWIVAHWAAALAQIQPDATAMVFRTRPDVLLNCTLTGLSALRRSLLAKERLHASLGWAPAHSSQGDLVFLTSWSAYESSIALPLEVSGRVARRRSSLEHLEADTASRDAREQEALATRRTLFDRAMLNGWGYGRSMSDAEAAPAVQRCLDACIDLEHARPFPRDGDGSPVRHSVRALHRAGDGRPSIHRSALVRSCMLNIVELPALHFKVVRKAARDGWAAASDGAPSNHIDLNLLRPLCPKPPSTSGAVCHPNRCLYGFLSFTVSHSPISHSKAEASLLPTSSKALRHAAVCWRPLRNRTLSVEDAAQRCLPTQHMFSARAGELLRAGFCKRALANTRDAAWCAHQLQIQPTVALKMVTEPIYPINPDYVRPLGSG